MRAGPTNECGPRQGDLVSERERSRVRLVRPTLLTWVATAATFSAISFTVVFLIVGYSSLPSLLPVHFNHAGFANGWQYKTYARVMMPGFVQMALTLIFG